MGLLQKKKGKYKRHGIYKEEKLTKTYKDKHNRSVKKDKHVSMLQRGHMYLQNITMIKITNDLKEKFNFISLNYMTRKPV